MTPTHKGIVKNGKLEYVNEERFLMWVGGLEGEVEVIVRKPKKYVSDQQRKYYFAYVDLIKEGTGNDKDTLHTLFKSEFLPKETKILFGKEVTVLGSTKNLTPEQMSEFIMKIELLTGIPAPDPNDVYVP